MATITFKGNPVKTIGNLPSKGSVAPGFVLTGSDLSDVKLSNYKGRKVILNIFPSIDTGVCANSVRKFNEKASNIGDSVVICISRDLPFAHNRFCVTEGLKNVISASEMKDNKFGEAYGVTMNEGPLAGLHSRAVVVINEKGEVVHTEQVSEIAQEPNYERALEALN